MYTLALLNGGLGTRVARGPAEAADPGQPTSRPWSIHSSRSTRCRRVTQIVLNYPEGWRAEIEKLVKDYAISTPITYVPGGQSRLRVRPADAAALRERARDRARDRTASGLGPPTSPN